jgi:hypothetical protein
MPSEAAAIDDKCISAERDYMRKLWSEYSKETSELERYALTLAGIIWSWCLSNSSASGTKVLIFLPALTTALFGLRAYAIFKMRRTIKMYMDELQKLSGLPSTFGWENYLSGHGYNIRIVTSYAFWVILHLSSIAIGIAVVRLMH